MVGRDNAVNTIADQIAKLDSMTTAELAAEFERLFGRRPRYRSVPWMRLCSGMMETILPSSAGIAPPS